MKIPLIKPQINQKKLIKDVKEIANSGILTKGKFVLKFEEALAKYLKVKYAYTTTSATTALHLALLVGGIKSGDEVLVSDFSFPASGNVVVQVGAKPVFVDIDLKTFDLDLKDLEEKITAKTKAIMVVHAFGYPANMTGICKIAKKHHLFVIEDAACAIGSKHKDKYCGAWGDTGCFSFHPRKVITTGEGGAIVTNNPQVAKKIEILRNHGGVKGVYGIEFIENGFNYRMTEIQAAIGAEQMKSLDKINRDRQKIAKKYQKLLKNIENLIIPVEPKDGDFNFQSFVVLLSQKVNRNKVIQKMAQKGIETTLGTYAMHSEPAFAKFGYKKADLVKSYYAYQHTLTLPLFESLTDHQLKLIVLALKKALNF